VRFPSFKISYILRSLIERREKKKGEREKEEEGGGKGRGVLPFLPNPKPAMEGGGSKKRGKGKKERGEGKEGRVSEIKS